MKERSFYVAVAKSNGQTGIAILEYEDGTMISTDGLYFERDLPFNQTTAAYGDYILERLQTDERAVIKTSYAAARGRHRYPFKFTARQNTKEYKKAREFAFMTILARQNTKLEEL